MRNHPTQAHTKFLPTRYGLSSLQALITFKSGAFSAGAPVQPVLLRYHNRELDPSWTHTGLPQLRLFFLMLAQLNNYASIEFLPVYHPSAAEQFDATLFSK